MPFAADVLLVLLVGLPDGSPRPEPDEPPRAGIGSSSEKAVEVEVTFLEVLKAELSLSDRLKNKLSSESESSDSNVGSLGLITPSGDELDDMQCQRI